MQVQRERAWLLQRQVAPVPRGSYLSLSGTGEGRPKGRKALGSEAGIISMTVSLPDTSVLVQYLHDGPGRCPRDANGVTSHCLALPRLRCAAEGKGWPSGEGIVSSCHQPMGQE